MRIRVLTDGRPANRTQGLGLAEAMAALAGAEVDHRPVALRPWAEPLPNRVLAIRANRVFSDDLAVSGRPDLVIGAGRRGNLAASRWLHTGVPTIAVLNPQLRLCRFRAVIVPAHDGLHGPNVIETLGAMNRLTPDRIAGASRPFPALPPPRLAVLLGGPGPSTSFGGDGIERLAADLNRFGGWSLLATPSRRTPGWAPKLLAQLLPDMWCWDGSGENPYPGLLAAADAILVTADSVNMLSEAAGTGKPVFVTGTASPGSKHARFHEALAARRITRPAAAGPGHWSYSPLEEASRVAALLATRLGFPISQPRTI